MLSADNGLDIMCAVQPGGRCNGFWGTQLSCTDVHAIYGAERIRSDRIGLEKNALCDVLAQRSR
jgi:hypothetical protein